MQQSAQPSSLSGCSICLYSRAQACARNAYIVTHLAVNTLKKQLRSCTIAAGTPHGKLHHTQGTPCVRKITLRCQFKHVLRTPMHTSSCVLAVCISGWACGAIMCTVPSCVLMLSYCAIILAVASCTFRRYRHSRAFADSASEEDRNVVPLANLTAFWSLDIPVSQAGAWPRGRGRGAGPTVCQGLSSRSSARRAPSPLPALVFRQTLRVGSLEVSDSIESETLSVSHTGHESCMHHARGRGGSMVFPTDCLTTSRFGPQPTIFLLRESLAVLLHVFFGQPCRLTN